MLIRPSGRSPARPPAASQSKGRPIVALTLWAVWDHIERPVTLPLISAKSRLTYGLSVICCVASSALVFLSFAGLQTRRVAVGAPGWPAGHEEFGQSMAPFAARSQNRQTTSFLGLFGLSEVKFGRKKKQQRQLK